METYNADWVLDFVPINPDDKGMCAEIPLGDKKIYLYNDERWPYFLPFFDEKRKTRIFFTGNTIETKSGAVTFWKFCWAVALWEAVFIHKMHDPVVLDDSKCVERQDLIALHTGQKIADPQPQFSFWPLKKEEPEVAETAVTRSPQDEGKQNSFLQLPDTHWSGTIGKGLTAEEFEHYCETLDLNTSPTGKNISWRPSMIVLHNTGAPKMSEWHRTPGVERMRNLTHYYRDQQRWSAGPHLFVADDLIWLFTPLVVPGVHSPSWNHVSWGVEMVGDYNTEKLLPATEHNVVTALGSLCRLGGLIPSNIHLHKEDPRTTHRDCPGKNIDATVLYEKVQEYLAKSGERSVLPIMG